MLSSFQVQDGRFLDDCQLVTPHKTACSNSFCPEKLLDYYFNNNPNKNKLTKDSSMALY